jgi:hypothetical protein
MKIERHGEWQNVPEDRAGCNHGRRTDRPGRVARRIGVAGCTEVELETCAFVRGRPGTSAAAGFLPGGPMNKTTTIVAGAALLVGLAACERRETPREEPGEEQPVRERLREEAREEAREVERERAEFNKGVQNRLREVEKDLDGLEQKTEQVAYRGKQAVSDALREVETARAKLNRDLQRLESASEREWEALKEEVDHDVDQLEDAVEKAADRVKDVEIEIKDKDEPAQTPVKGDERP